MNRLHIAPLAAAALASVALLAQPALAQASGPFANCPAAYAAGRSHIPKGDPAYATNLDRDGDGIGCDDPPAGFRPAPPTKASTTTRKAATPTTRSATKATGAVRATPRFTG
jgi:hypothetical protein